MIADSKQREAAIDVSRSAIVQAPAGSGKTELLIQRLLALLSVVERPQQILAITFTNKAAAEMRQRLLQALETARDAPCPDAAHAAKTWRLAARALRHHGESLLRNPSQLAIQTIDSFNATLVRKMPWISRFGSLPEISDDPEQLYRLAAQKLLSRFERGDDGVVPLQLLLRHLDNNVALVEQMLVVMLKQRDQWLRHLLNAEENTRICLQHGLEQLCSQQLKGLVDQFPVALTDDLLACLNFSVTQRESSGVTDGCFWNALPGCAYDDLKAWSEIADLLLTAAGGLRKTVTKKNGFPAGKEYKSAKERMVALLHALEANTLFVRHLAAIRALPKSGYDDRQWQLLQALMTLLPLLVGELWMVFQSSGKTDFAEIALKAEQALGAADNPSDLLLQLDHDLHHILIDEFQDTSRLQYRLLDTLTSGWTAGDGRTLFLVGDPMQSIYRFREAEVGLFLDSFKGCFGTLQHPLEPLQLCSNFRSQAGIVNWVNRAFATLFPAVIDVATGAVPLTEAVAVKAAAKGESCCFYPFAGRDDAAEAQQVLELVQQAQHEDPHQTIAILVRGRNHLREILPLLRQHQISYQAQDIDPLAGRPAALDIVHLTRALLHRADRLSWLAVLRAPWCGLTLDDLHLLVGESVAGTLPTLLAQENLQLSAVGQIRLRRIWPVLQTALQRRGRVPLRQLVEECWLALGGPAAASVDGCRDAQLVFELLDKLDHGGDLESFESLDRAVAKLFAKPDSFADGQLQIMTIHKAKGLEFGTVIIPGLGKATRRSDTPLLRWQEDPRYGLLLAPVSVRGSQEKDPIYQLITKLDAEKHDLETGRLLYVATTRAIQRLFLLGHAEENSKGEFSPGKGSLLEKLWPLFEGEFNVLERRIITEKSESKTPLLRRLVSDWSSPTPISARLTTVSKLKSPSFRAAGEVVFSGWENSTQRHVGTLVHLQLEQLAVAGDDFWLKTDERERSHRLKQQLMGYGVAGVDLDMGVKRVIAAINTTLASSRGRWILSPHLEHRCELPLTGVVNDQLIHAVIDRSFVADGVRWIIDYKSSTPVAGETEADFLRREADHYRSQLHIYLQLVALDSAEPVRAALYFPVIDGWYEYPVFS